MLDSTEDSEETTKPRISKFRKLYSVGDLTYKQITTERH